MTKQPITINSEQDMLDFGKSLSEQLKPGDVVFLRGGLGAGKTVLTRGILRGFGFNGTVKSPTYTIVEPYELENVTLYHFDLYRIAGGQDLDDIGYTDFLNDNAICVIEWPEKAEGYLAEADIDIDIKVVSTQSREVIITLDRLPRR